MESDDINRLILYASTAEDFLVRKRCTAVLLVRTGETKVDVAEELCCDRRTVYEWVKSYETEGLQSLLQCNTGGRPLLVPHTCYDNIKATILSTQSRQSPATGNELQKDLSAIGYELSRASVYNLMHRLKLSYQTPRPVHPKRDENAVKEWLEALPTVVDEVAQAHPDEKLEVYFGDETRFGQQGILVRQWSEVGNRPTRERQIEYKNAWIFGAVNPRTGDHHGIVTTHAATDFMQMFIDSFSSSLGLGVHALLVVDNAAWHHSSSLAIPSNVTLHFLPPYSPELNPSERLWKFMKSKFLCNQLYQDVEEIIETGVDAWRKLSTEIVKSVCACNFIPT